MSRPAGYRPVVWLRRFLLVALVAFLGVVAGLLIKGRSSGPGEPTAPNVADSLGAGGDAELSSGKGFSHQVTEEGEPRYRISASSWTLTRDELVRLNDVAIQFERETDDDFTVEADSGLYQQSDAAATLIGNVRIRNSEGFEITGQGFELKRRGGLIVSTGGPVRFRYQDRFVGSARELRSNLRKKRSEMSGAVEIKSLAGEAIDASLSARRLVFEEPEGLIHAEGGVVLKRDGEEITARRISIELDEAGKRPRFVRARWDVTGARPQMEDGVPRTLRFASDRLSLRFDEATGDPVAAELEGADRVPARLEIAGADGEVRRLETPYLVASFTAGAIARADVEGPVALTDFLAVQPDLALLTGCADRAEARFRRNGELETLVLGGDVEFNRAEAQISGDEVEARGSGEVVVSGEPARVFSSRGQFEAPEILYRTANQAGSAGGGVRAMLEGRGGLGLMNNGEAARQPINVTAEKADWSAGGDKVTFRQEVRAWQDENYLTASELEIADSGRSLIARGGVTTVIKQERAVTTEGEDDTEERRGGGARTATAPLQVTAAELDFDGANDVLHYTGSPRARQAGRTLSCTKLDVELDAASEVERMLCSGSALIESPADGQTVTGEEALYRPGSENVEITGNPVVLRNADGRLVRGARVLYDFKTGQATFLTSDATLPPTSAAAVAGDDPPESGDGGPEG